MPRTMVDLTGDRELFHGLVNPELSHEHLKAARACIDNAHTWTEENVFKRPDTSNELYMRFTYTEDSFNERLRQIYERLADKSDAYDPARDSVFSTREMVLQRIRQFAPNNLTDGIWLTGIARLSGPATQVRTLLLHILEDELGNGNPVLNHANVYRDLLSQEHIYLPDPTSAEFARSAELVEEAFQMPAYLAATAQFPATGFAWTLGITLAFEWTSVALTPMIKLCRHYGINDHFYKLHKGIDNPLTGHGAWAVEAVKLHLSHVADNHGQEAMQSEWQRIWTAFVTFQCYGDLDTVFKRIRVEPPLSLTERMEKMIAGKSFAALSHDHARIDGPDTPKVRDLFKEPKKFVRLLASSKRLIVPGKPDASQLIQDMSFTGPMFRVFTEDEQKLVREWIVELGSSPPAVNRIAAAAKATRAESSDLAYMGNSELVVGDSATALPRMAK